MRYRVKPEEERCTYVIANPFNAVRDWHGQRSGHYVPIKVEIKDHGIGIGRRGSVGKRLINFTAYYSNGGDKNGWIWTDSWDKAKNWADQRVGLNTEEPVVHIGQRYGTPQYK